jgi:hypothetical protein
VIAGARGVAAQLLDALADGRTLGGIAGGVVEVGVGFEDFCELLLALDTVGDEIHGIDLEAVDPGACPRLDDAIASQPLIGRPGLGRGRGLRILCAEPAHGEHRRRHAQQHPTASPNDDHRPGHRCMLAPTNRNEKGG